MTAVEGHPKPPFPYRYLPGGRGLCVSYPWISPLTFDPKYSVIREFSYYWVLSREASSTIFQVLGETHRLGIEPTTLRTIRLRDVSVVINSKELFLKSILYDNNNLRIQTLFQRPCNVILILKRFDGCWNNVVYLLGSRIKIMILKVVKVIIFTYFC